VRIDLEQSVEAPPVAVWGWLTDPLRMNRWSTARIEPIAPGEQGRMDGVGALRRVITPGLASTRLVEVIRRSEPPHRFVYVVFDGAPALRRHEGEITLTPTGVRTNVSWRVTMSFALPGLGAIARASIAPELRRSLATMAMLAAGGTPEPMPTFALLESAPLAPIRVEAERVLAEQRAIAERLEAAKDPKQWFARVYALVTEEQLAHVDRGEVDYPEWALRLIPAFHDYYLRGLDGFERGTPIEPAWQRAWSRASTATAPRDVVKGLLLGVAAHIEADLPHALAETWRAHFADRCELVRFRADYVRMADVFRHASDRLVERMPRDFLPAWLRAARAATPPELGGQLMRRYYDVPKKRLAAFARAVELSGAA
jgi:uncharacterized protein YndB with AHSA1/START domain